jgi:hypothetical protein
MADRIAPPYCTLSPILASCVSFFFRLLSTIRRSRINLHPKPKPKPKPKPEPRVRVRVKRELELEKDRAMSRPRLSDVNSPSPFQLRISILQAVYRDRVKVD